MLTIENRFVKVELSENADFLAVTDLATGDQLTTTAPLALTYGNSYTYILHDKQGKITTSKGDDFLQIDFSDFVCWARHRDNVYCKPTHLKDFSFSARIVLKGEEISFEVNPMTGMDGEVFDISFPNGLFQLPSTEPARAFVFDAYGMEFRFPVAPEQFAEVPRPDNSVSLFAAYRPEKSGFAVWTESWEDIGFKLLINGRMPGKFGWNVTQHFTPLANYTHKQRFRFLAPGATVCDIAKWYRKLLKEIGRLKTMREKIAESPAAEKLVGSIIWKADVFYQDKSPRNHEESYWAFKPGYSKIEGKQNFWSAKEIFDAARAAGADRICLYNMGWNCHGYDDGFPTRLPVNPERGTEAQIAAATEYGKAISDGYINSVHDNYSDCYTSSPEFTFDEMMQDNRGGVVTGGVWMGGRAYLICSKVALKYARRDLPKMKEIYNTDSLYIDVICRGGLHECYHKDHPQSRRQDAENKRNILKYAREVFGSLGSECTPAPHCVDILDVGAFSFWTLKKNLHPQMPMAFPVPFWQLALHDCVMTCSAEGFYEAWHPGDYLAMMALYGLLPMAIDETEIRISKEMRNTYLEEMTSFEYLNGDGEMRKMPDGSISFYGVMKTTFADGVSVIANMTDEQYEDVKPHDFKIYK